MMKLDMRSMTSGGSASLRRIDIHLQFWYRIILLYFLSLYILSICVLNIGQFLLVHDTEGYEQCAGILSLDMNDAYIGCPIFGYLLRQSFISDAEMYGDTLLPNPDLSRRR